MKMHKLITTSLFALLAYCLSGAALAQNLRLLSEVRDDIVFEELTAEEKQRLAEQVRLVFRDLYVNRLAKQDFYLDLPDPLVELDAIAGEAAELSTAELEIRLAKTVLAQRDFHLRYTLPRPFGTFFSVLPIVFQRTSQGDNPFEVRVNAVNANLFEQFAPDQRVPELGDLVVAYNGQPTREAVEAIIPMGGGANTWGGFKRAMDRLTFRAHSNDLLPETDEVTLEIRSRVSGESYTVTLPWLSSRSRLVDLFDLPISSTDQTRIQKQAIAMDQYEMMRQEVMKMADLMPQSGYPDNPSALKEVSWGVIDNRFGSFGYIRIESFNSNDVIVGEVRRLLLNELKETDALILDVRNNGGGVTDTAEQLPQLFGGAEASPFEFRLLNTDLVQRVGSTVSFSMAEFEDVAALNAAAGTGDTYTSRFGLAFAEDLNTLGQVYFKPVGVLMNARSYSATDLFTCRMQDDGRAIIYGEDGRTGAGGASVVNHSFLVAAGIEPFDRLPAGHELSFAYMQAIRTGINDGELIEDFGCEADVDVSPVARDLVSGNASQIEKITRDLARRTRRFEAFSQAQPVNDLNALAVDLHRPSYRISTRGTRSINVYRDGELKKNARALSFFKFKDIVLDLAGVVEEGENNIVLRGVDYRGNESWSYKLTLFALDIDVPSVQVDELGAVIDFSRPEAAESLSIFNFAEGQSWRFENPFLQISSPDFSRTYSEAVLKLDLSAVNNAELGVEIASINFFDLDQFDIYVTTDDVFAGAKTVLLPSLDAARESGVLSSTDGSPFGLGSLAGTVELSLDDFVGRQNVYVHFRFIARTPISTDVQIGKITVQ